jgi:DNA-binding winged helix-turn-helix (wHTH) protein
MRAQAVEPTLLECETARVHRLEPVARQEQHRSLFLRWREFELDEACFELRRHGRPVALQPKALDLLLYLARHRERVVTKRELLHRVWRDVTVCEASLSQAVSVARRAVSDVRAERHTIRTIRSKGFRFVADVEPEPSALPDLRGHCPHLLELLERHAASGCRGSSCPIASERLGVDLRLVP